MPKESRHARALRRLGFERMDEAVEIYMNRRTERRLNQMNVPARVAALSRNERRRFKQALATPTYLVIRSDDRVTTYVTDEVDGHWVLQDAPDADALEKLGFEDSAEYAAVAAAMPPLPAERMN